ncbi:MAG: recombinase family protein, partial [Acidobacteriota bacterium]
MNEQVRWVAIYERVSSDDQRERETIKTQTEVIDRYLAVRSDFRVYRRYHDDGISGKLRLRERPEGSRLLADARAGKFQAIVMTRPDRLGRNEIDRLQ